ncbi:MAG: hypothetical protein ACK2T6_07395 [Anaerolineae bacterium]|jgi:hypothetical protein
MSTRQKLAIVLGALLALAALPVLAQAEQTWTVTGAITGGGGGPADIYMVDFAPSTHVTLTLQHDPCELAGDKLKIEVYGPEYALPGVLTTQSCQRQLVLYTIGGGPGRIEIHNFDPAITVNYTLSSQGVALPGGGPPPEPTPVPPAPADDPTTASGDLAGTTGGAIFDVPAFADKALPYTIEMKYTMASGGSSVTGIGFKVLTATGTQLATSEEYTPNSHRATFTPPPNMNLQIEVFNYISGQVLNYQLSGLPAGEEG